MSERAASSAHTDSSSWYIGPQFNFIYLDLFHETEVVKGLYSETVLAFGNGEIVTRNLPNRTNLWISGGGGAPYRNCNLS